MSHAPVQYQLSLATPAALAAYTSAFDADDLAYVASLDAVFYFSPASVAAVDNTTVINGPGGVGRWLLTPADARPIFGDGSDGVQTFDGVAVVLGLVPAANVYTLTRDIYLASGSSLAVAATIKTDGFAIFCNGTFTNAGIISNDGLDGALGVAGAGSAAGSAGIGTAGGAGGTAAPGTGATNVVLGLFGATGAGGAGGGDGVNAGGAGGTYTALAAALGGGRHLEALLNGYTVGQAAGAVTFSMLAGGAGGGGGGGTGGGTGGGGGGGGGVLRLHVYNLINTGAVRATGGAGAAGSGGAGSAGGGGGGGGGLVLNLSRYKSGAGGMTAAGGAGGALFGAGGVIGADGAAGAVISLIA
jgi:hypothetical protein